MGQRPFGGLRVISIEMIMLVALGFLGAALLGLGLLPAYRRRTERLTREQIKRSMPLTEAEIRADKDRLRADFAIVIHELEEKLEKGNLVAARQKVEINRRDAAISALEGELSVLRTSLEGHENARRVLEQTIMDRLPKVEMRLVEARKLLTQRDREITELSHSADKRASALEEASQINTQNRDEIHRLNAALATRAARNRDGLGDQRFDGEVALRSEIESLRAKTREQTSMIARLQGLLERAGGALGADAIAKHPPVLTARAKSNGVEAGADKFTKLQRADDEIARLRSELTEAEAKLRNLQNTAEAGQAGRTEAEKQIRQLNTKIDDQTAEIARLKAALQTYEDSDRTEQAISDSKMSLKAKLVSLQAQSDEQVATISRLRAEVAAANEKLARQASHYVNEMRRLGVGTLPAVAANSDTTRETTSTSTRQSLQERISAPRPPPVARAFGRDGQVAGSTNGQRNEVGETNAGDGDNRSKKSSGLMRALDGFASGKNMVAERFKAFNTSEEEQRSAEEAQGAELGGKDQDDEGQKSTGEQPRRGGLLERITRINIAK